MTFEIAGDLLESLSKQFKGPMMIEKQESEKQESESTIKAVQKNYVKDKATEQKTKKKMNNEKKRSKREQKKI